ncbi:MAG TPA: PilC/PilY family type IV pilus protein, partial [Phycisphaerales bacterium]|nr:PilC/PilY family type IV pilus protein [Phycisphaerales bacterium]
PQCTSWSNSGSMTYLSPYGPDDDTCVSSGSITLPSPNPSSAVAVSSVTTTGIIGGTPNTLADVALYYYQTDLRDASLANCTGALGASVCQDNVFISGTDNNLKQHMTTFTLGLGVRGKMVYSSSYLTDTDGDFAAVKLGKTADATTCTWQTAGTVCTWPVPTSGSPETTDDLWHAAVNGRGAYFSATDPTTLANGLSNALTSISSKVGAAAAAATSTLNPVAGNNLAFVASYTTLKWTGNLEARGINTTTGVVSENATWCVENVAGAVCTAPATLVADTSGDTTAYYCVTPNSVTCPSGELDGTDCRVPVATTCTGTMNALVADSTDTRTIKTASDDGTALVDFDTAYRAAHPQYFDATVLANLSQWPPAADASATADLFRANAPGDNLLRYLRGQRGHEYARSGVPVQDQYYRQREAILGDALESQPAFIGAPNFNYPYNGYPEFKSNNSSRTGTVYMGTNDGMLHAFAADTGIERWAYIPSMVIPNLWMLADQQYGDRHVNFVNGSPVTTDVCTANCGNAYNAATPATNPVWRTILVAGLNGGGRGYFALDITNPATPALLWEFTTTGGIGKVTDNDLGYTYGNPVVTRREDGRWVVLVTSGYDNGTHGPTKVSGNFVAQTPGGNGQGYLYVLDAGTGTILSKISTGVGTAASPSGLGKISAYNAEPGGNKVSFVYGGDLKGNLWRFDINSTEDATIGKGKAFKLATLYSDAAATQPQPIMTAPALGVILGKRVIFVGTGKYLEVPDLANTQTQSLYAIKDDDATTTLVNPRTTLVQQFLINNPDGTATRISAKAADATETGSNEVDFGVHRGWFLDFPESRERVNL